MKKLMTSIKPSLAEVSFVNLTTISTGFCHTKVCVWLLPLRDIYDNVLYHAKEIHSKLHVATTMSTAVK